MRVFSSAARFTATTMLSLVGAARAASASAGVSAAGGVAPLPGPPPPPVTADVISDRVRGAILGMAIGA